MGSNAKLTVEVRDPRFKDVVGDAVDIAKVGSGYLFTEGPIWHPVEKHLTFSDIPDNCMHRWTAELCELDLTISKTRVFFYCQRPWRREKDTGGR